MPAASWAFGSCPDYSAQIEQAAHWWELPHPEARDFLRLLTAQMGSATPENSAPVTVGSTSTRAVLGARRDAVI